MKAIAKPLSGVGVHWGLSIKFAVIIASPGCVRGMQCCKKQWQIQERAPPLLIFLGQTEARRAIKKFWWLGTPPYLRVWMFPPFIWRSGSCTEKLFLSANRWWDSLYVLFCYMSERRDSLGLPSEGAMSFSNLADISNWNWGSSFFLFKCHIQSGVNKRQLFLRKFYFFNFLVSWWKVGFMAVYLSTLKQQYFFWN